MRDIDGFVDLVRRVQIPGYEEVRQLYGHGAVQGEYADANEHYPYTQEAIAALRGAPGGGPDRSPTASDSG